MRLERFPRGRKQARETGSMLDQPNVESALKSFTDNLKKKEM